MRSAAGGKVQVQNPQRGDAVDRYKIDGTDLWVMRAQVSDRGVYRCVVTPLVGHPIIWDSALGKLLVQAYSDFSIDTN